MASEQDNTDELGIVRVGMPVKDGCPILRRTKAFVIQEGVVATLEFVFRDPRGLPVDLTPVNRISQSSTSSQSAAEDAGDTVLLRLREIMGNSSSKTWQVEGTIVDAANGVVRAALPTDFTGSSGIYTAGWAFVRNYQTKLINTALISVEPTLYGSEHSGPPTLNELRMHMWDSDPNENVLLDDVEFGDEQIIEAITKPVEYFNEATPRLSVIYNTKNFPWHSQWVDAIIAHLLSFAAAYYRRNRLQGSAGGINVDDLNKEREYTAASKADWDAYKTFVLIKKTELNMADGCADWGSVYGTESHSM